MLSAADGGVEHEQHAHTGERPARVRVVVAHPSQIETTARACERRA